MIPIRGFTRPLLSNTAITICNRSYNVNPIRKAFGLRNYSHAVKTTKVTALLSHPLASTTKLQFQQVSHVFLLGGGLGLVSSALTNSKAAFCEQLKEQQYRLNHGTSIPKQKRLKIVEKTVPESKDEPKVVDPNSYLLKLMAKDKLLFILAALSSILGSLATSAQARVVGALFDLIGSADTLAYIAPVKKLIALFLGQAGLSFLASVSLALATNRLGTNLRKEFFAAVLRQDIEMFDSSKSGELAHQLAQDVGALQTSIRTLFTRGIESVTSIISGSIVLYYTSSKLALCMFGLLPVASLGANLMGHILRELSLQTRKASNYATGIASESIGSIRTVRAFAAEERELQRYSDALDQVSGLKKSMAIAAGTFYACLHLGINCVTLIICAYGGHLVSNGELTKGGIAAAVTQVQMLERALARMSILSAQFTKAMKASDHIFALINSVPKVNRDDLGLCLLHPIGDVQFSDVSFTYPSRPDKVVLENFNLHAKPGMVVALVGHSGSGKSTTASLLKRFYDVSEGSVSLDGYDLRELNPKWLHHVVGIVSQEPALFSGSVKENIRFGNPEATDKEVFEAARQANAHKFIQDFPQGYNTELGERGVLLSGGQKQRIAIARCLLRDPKVLILDEATSALDAESEHLVQQALQKLMAGRTTLVIAHRLTTIRNADLICVMDNGKIIEQGNHTQLMQNSGGAYKSLFKRQHNMNRHDSKTTFT